MEATQGPAGLPVSKHGLSKGMLQRLLCYLHTQQKSIARQESAPLTG
jgi:hypothetical protein